jgi:hypothetical protein
MRFGTRTELGCRWTAKAVRPSAEQIIGYEYGYFSVALKQRSDELFALILPDMTVKSFQVFVDDICKFRQPANSRQTNHERSGGASQHSFESQRRTVD